MSYSRILGSFLIGLVAAWALSAAFPQSARAAGMNPYTCGMACLGQGGGMLRPFTGQPYFPVNGGSYAYSTGQMSYYQNAPQQTVVDMTPVYVSNVFNWNGAQPMGFSYLPPMGLSAISNSLMFNGALGGRAY